MKDYYSFKDQIKDICLVYNQAENLYDIASDLKKKLRERLHKRLEPVLKKYLKERYGAVRINLDVDDGGAMSFIIYSNNAEDFNYEQTSRHKVSDSLFGKKVYVIWIYLPDEMDRKTAEETAHTLLKSIKTTLQK